MREPSDEAFEALRGYIDDVRHRLNLVQWTLRLSRRPPTRTASTGNVVVAQIDPVDGRFLATLRFDEEFWTDPPVEQRNTVVHELAHLYHQPLTSPIEWGPLEKLLGTAAWELFRDAVNRGAEQMTDHLGRVLAELVPLPELPKLEDWPDS